jgi:hypothetical protein
MIDSGTSRGGLTRLIQGVRLIINQSPLKGGETDEIL